MKHIILLGACVLLIAGCATVNHTALTPEKSAQLAGKTFASTHYPTPDFVASTAGKAAFAMLGAVAAIAEGNEIVRTNGVEDPALTISQAVVDRLAAARDGRPLQRKAQMKSEDVAAIVAAHPDVDYVVDVRTFTWMFTYYPHDWSHYRVTYIAVGRLIETSTRQVVAQTICRSVQGDDKSPPTKDQLLEKQAALLKNYLDKAAAGCVEVLSKEMLML